MGVGLVEGARVAAAVGADQGGAGGVGGAGGAVAGEVAAVQGVAADLRVRVAVGVAGEVDLKLAGDGVGLQGDEAAVADGADARKATAAGDGVAAVASTVVQAGVERA